MENAIFIRSLQHLCMKSDTNSNIMDIRKSEEMEVCIKTVCCIEDIFTMNNLAVATCGQITLKPVGVSIIIAHRIFFLKHSEYIRMNENIQIPILVDKILNICYRSKNKLYREMFYNFLQYFHPNSVQDQPFVTNLTF
jgi:hypothetical protein